MKKGARDRSTTARGLGRGGVGSRWDDAGSCSTTTSRTTSARKNKKTSGCTGMYWPDWVISIGRKSLVVI